MLTNHISFADDVTAWITSADLTHACNQMTLELCDLLKYTIKWPLNISAPKTEAMVLGKKESPKIVVKLGNSTLKQVSSKKCLGIVIDEKLSFNEHADYVAHKSRAALNKIRCLLAYVKSAEVIHAVTSSAKLIWLVSILFISLTKEIKRRGAITEPWGTPMSVVIGESI